jgi:hypothetical protein
MALAIVICIVKMVQPQVHVVSDAHDVMVPLTKSFRR